MKNIITLTWLLTISNLVIANPSIDYDRDASGGGFLGVLLGVVFILAIFLLDKNTKAKKQQAKINQLEEKIEHEKRLVETEKKFKSLQREIDIYNETNMLPKDAGTTTYILEELYNIEVTLSVKNKVEKLRDKPRSLFEDELTKPYYLAISVAEDVIMDAVDNQAHNYFEIKDDFLKGAEAMFDAGLISILDHSDYIRMFVLMIDDDFKGDWVPRKKRELQESERKK